MMYVVKVYSKAQYALRVWVLAEIPSTGNYSMLHLSRTDRVPTKGRLPYGSSGRPGGLSLALLAFLLRGIGLGS